MSSRCSTARLSCDKADDRHVEFLGELLKAAADLRNFLYAIIVRAPLPGPLEQLEIVDDDQADALLPLEAAGAGAQRGDGQARRVVDVERQALQSAAARASERNSCWLILPVRRFLGGDPRLLGQNAGRELVGRHFQAEQGDRRAGRLGRLDPVRLILAESARAAAKAMFVASALLPMPGRPATMIRSDL